jgi:hypothetical protein
MRFFSKTNWQFKRPGFRDRHKDATSCYSRLYSLTNNDLYKAVADSILYTMTDYASPYSPVMISEADGVGLDKDYYWVDEYPHPTRVYVLNGSIIGAMGLYDHWWVFGDRKSKTLLSRELTTPQRPRVMLYRNEGDISCLRPQISG